MSTRSQSKINFMFFLEKAGLKSNIYCLYGNDGTASSHRQNYLIFAPVQVMITVCQKTDCAD